MRQRGRKSAAHLALPEVDVARRPLKPPSTLTKSERTLFAELADDASHLRPADAPMLGMYVQALQLARRLGRDASRIADWEKAARAAAMLARSLRLTAQSRIDPQTVGRTQPRAFSPPWE